MIRFALAANEAFEGRLLLGPLVATRAGRGQGAECGQALCFWADHFADVRVRRSGRQAEQAAGELEIDQAAFAGDARLLALCDGGEARDHGVRIGRWWLPQGGVFEL
ncbi:MAG: hypothetical protein Q8N18_22445 [Opitutaceae bacterium]|nr:hypothetical protein [Opitutaceae bacterium]